MAGLPEHAAAQDKPYLVGMTHPQLEEFFRGLGQDTYRATQVMKWIHQGLLESMDGMTNLSKALRQEVSERARIGFPEHVSTLEAEDGTRKFLLRLHDGQTIETVLIPGEDHDTLCVSTQVGCAMGCRICRTAGMGLVRNLTAGEIVAQLLTVRRIVPESRITNVVFMGMGEPLANFRETVNAVRIMTHPNGPGISWRHLTVSTSGLVPRIHDLGREVRVKLAISLNAVTDEQRTAIMPINRKYPLAELLAAARDYPLPRRDRITFEYVLIDRFNDSDADARQLVRLLNEIRAKVNLIPLNDEGLEGLRSPDPARVARFQDILLSKSLVAIIRKSRGRDILAACGQLRRSVAAGTDKPTGDRYAGQV
ncbi:MAG: 23S rRNA (adenine(2503)-C(2))-methyltransferase RlmN [Thermodesulfobacteriota bacterium]